MRITAPGKMACRNGAPNPAEQLLVIEVFCELLAAADPPEVGLRICEQARELTGARTVLLIGHPEEEGPHCLFHVTPHRRNGLFSPEELGLFCFSCLPENLPPLSSALSLTHPLREPLLRSGVESFLRIPLLMGGTFAGALVLLDLPEVDRMAEAEEIVTRLAPIMAIALRNACSRIRIEEQSRELEKRVAEQTTDLQTANSQLEASRTAALSMMADAVAARERAESAAEALSQEILERKRAQEELGRLRNSLANIIDSMPSILVGVNGEGCVTQWNVRAVRATGVLARGALGRKLDEVFPGLADEFEEIRTAVQDGKTRVKPRQKRLIGNEARFEEMTIFPLADDGADGAVIRLDDVTERVRLEEMMVQSEKMLSVGGLAAGMAHELNNPLAGMIQSALVLDSRLKADQPANEREAAAAGTTMSAIRAYMAARGVPKLLAGLRESGARAAKVVKNMLSFARKSDHSFVPVDLSDLLERTLELAENDYNLKKKFDFRHIAIVREYEPGLPMVPCEEGNIQQVFLNILRNGAEAMHEMAVKEVDRRSRFLLRIHRESETDWVRVEIEDNGAGMEEPVCKRVFEPFFSTKPVGSGVGLGLSVSYFIITEIHHGKIVVESQPGVGSRFIIHLPLVRPLMPGRTP